MSDQKATVDNNMEKEPVLQGVIDNLENFIENINCIRETFGYSKWTLMTQHTDSLKNFDEFIASCSTTEEDGKKYVSVPEGKKREFLKLFKKKNRAERAFDLIPSSYFVTLVSVYDTFLAGLIRSIYNICPEKLQESQMQFLYKDLQQLKSLSDVKKKIIDKIIETQLRDSHRSQFDWLAKTLGVETLTKFSGWEEFVELTERRNLFVHSNGTVSTQYIEMCTKYGLLTAGIIEGMQLKVDDTYFENAYKTLYKTSVLLTQMVLRVLYLDKNQQANSEVDKVLIDNVYEMISDKLYDIAIDVSEQILNNKKMVHNSFDRAYIVLNLAQAYKWSGERDKCIEILNNEDWSACTNELLIPKYALEENYEEMYCKMKELGGFNKRITISSYREWPIFQEARKESGFMNAFKDIFGEELGIVQRVEIFDQIKAENKTSEFKTEV